jgi:protein SCO1/2
MSLRVLQPARAAWLAITLIATGSAAWSANPQTSREATSAAGEVKFASDSIFQLATPLTDQSGRPFKIGERAGRPMIVSMFYTSCQFVCPMLVDSIRATQQKLGDAERRRVDILLVSFDPVHDTVAVLRKTAEDRGLDGAWTLARTDAASVRKLAAVLGVQYRPIANGDFNHTTALVLLDGEGRIAGRTTQLGDADPGFVKLVKATLAAGRP